MSVKCSQQLFDDAGDIHMTESAVRKHNQGLWPFEMIDDFFGEKHVSCNVTGKTN